MNLLKKVLSLLLIVLTTTFCFPKINFAQDFRFHSKADEKTSFTEVQSTLDNEIQSLPEPEIRSTPEEDIPGKKSSNWTAILLGILVIAGIGAALGGGGGSSSSDGTTTTSDTGGMDVAW